MDFTKKDTYTYNGKVIEYSYSPTATYGEQCAFVAIVSDRVFIKGNYLPLLKDIAFDYVLLENFTDIDFVKTGINNIDAFAEFDKGTGLAKKLKANLNPTMLKTLTASVDANIEYKRQTAQDDFTTELTLLLKNLNDRFADSNNDIDPETTMAFMKKFIESGFDGESIAKAYLGSDAFKKNVENVIDKKNEDIRDLKQKLNAVTAKNVVADK